VDEPVKGQPRAHFFVTPPLPRKEGPGFGIEIAGSTFRQIIRIAAPFDINRKTKHNNKKTLQPTK